MSKNPIDEHTWFRRRIGVFRLGLLGDEEERFRRHLSSCDRCEEAYSAFSTDPGEEGARDGHLPPALVSRWDRTRLEIRGLERRLVREHLENCEECRHDLDFLGFTPVLEVVPRLEDPDPTVSRGEAVATEDSEQNGDCAVTFGEYVPEARSEPRPVRASAATGATQLEPAGPRARSISRLLVGWAAVATAALLIVFVRPVIVGPPDEEESAYLAPTLRIGNLRGGASSALSITDETQAVVLGISGLEVFFADTAITLELISPTGKALVKGVFAVEEIALPNGLVLSRGAEPLTEGIYQMSLRRDGGDSTEVMEYQFELRQAGRP